MNVKIENRSSTQKKCISIGILDHRFSYHKGKELKFRTYGLPDFVKLKLPAARKPEAIYGVALCVLASSD